MLSAVKKKKTTNGGILTETSVFSVWSDCQNHLPQRLGFLFRMEIFGSTLSDLLVQNLGMGINLFLF